MQEPILDVVGATEAHEILGVELQRISRWRKMGRLPPPYADLRLSPVWVRADIERVRDTGEASMFTTPPPEPLLLGTAEVAGLLGVDKSQVARWRARPNKRGPALPDPATQIKAGPLWSRPDVLLFGEQRLEREQRTEHRRDRLAELREQRQVIAAEIRTLNEGGNGS